MDKIKLIKPYISFREISTEMEEIFDSGQLTKGQHVEKFCQSLKEYTGAKHAFLMTSATTALTMCLKALNIQPGDKVAVSDFSYPASANVIEDLGAIPVFIDVDRDTYNMSVSELVRNISSGIKAVMFVDALGNPSGLNKIKEVCKQHSIPLVEDAACAIGSKIDGEKIGTVSDLTCFSFHPRKLLTTGEGGAILTNNDEYAAWLAIKSNHGASGMKGKGLNFVDYGYNYRMCEMQALLGWKQLAKLDEIVANRNLIAKNYEEMMTKYGFKRQKACENIRHNIQSLVFEVPENINRNELIDFLHTKNIESTIGTYSLSSCTYYKEKYDVVQPNSSALEARTITLPCYENVDYQKVANALIEFTVSDRDLEKL